MTGQRVRFGYADHRRCRGLAGARRGGERLVEHLKVADLSVGTYCIPAGGFDDQSPHSEDEIYVVTADRATIVTSLASARVSPGSVILVPAGEEHRFTEVTEDLALLVVFGPAYGSRSPTVSVGSDR